MRKRFFASAGSASEGRTLRLGTSLSTTPQERLESTSMVVRNGEREGLAISCTQKTLLGACATHFSREHMTAHSVAQDQVVSASFTVIPHAHSHPVSLMSLLNVKFTPFPSLFSSPSASSSRVSTSIPGRARSWCQSLDAPARWRESGRLVDSTPNTGCEPNLANSSSYTDPEHTPIDIPDNNPDVRCSDDVTMMSTSAEGIPNSEALSSSRKAAASKVSSLFGHS